jgi:hypothetical protein
VKCCGIALFGMDLSPHGLVSAGADCSLDAFNRFPPLFYLVVELKFGRSGWFRVFRSLRRRVFGLVSLGHDFCLDAGPFFCSFC